MLLFLYCPEFIFFVCFLYTYTPCYKLFYNSCNMFSKTYLSFLCGILLYTSVFSITALPLWHIPYFPCFYCCTSQNSYFCMLSLYLYSVLQTFYNSCNMFPETYLGFLCGTQFCTSIFFIPALSLWHILYFQSFYSCPEFIFFMLPLYLYFVLQTFL
jgi:hypothetical protein